VYELTNIVKKKDDNNKVFLLYLSNCHTRR